MTDALTTTLTAAGYASTRESADVVYVHGATVEDVGRHVASAGVVIYELTPVSSDLEDAFFALTGTDQQKAAS